jgi:hypothetical protein
MREIFLPAPFSPKLEPRKLGNLYEIRRQSLGNRLVRAAASGLRIEARLMAWHRQDRAGLASMPSISRASAGTPSPVAKRCSSSTI